MPALVTKIEQGREGADCAIATLAMYLGRSYEDTLRAVTRVDPDGGRQGLFTEQIQRAARKLGEPLRYRQRVSLDDDYGILCFPDHCNLLRRGQVIEPNGTIWDADDYCAAHGDPEGLLVASESTRPRRRPRGRGRRPDR